MRDPDSYYFREFHIRGDMLAALQRYVTERVPPGGFLRAVLAHDFMAACAQADDGNLRNLPAYAAYLYNEMPSSCHGSYDIVNQWLDTNHVREEGGAYADTAA